MTILNCGIGTGHWSASITRSMSSCANETAAKRARRRRSSTARAPREHKKGGFARSFRLRRGQEGQGSQATHPGRHARSLVERRGTSRQHPRSRWRLRGAAPSAPAIPLYRAHLRRRRLPWREDGPRRRTHGKLEIGDRETKRCRQRLRGAAQALDRRAHLRLDQPLSASHPGLRALRANHYRLHPSRHDPHHAPTARCKSLVMNLNFADGL